jgi:outer membrane lipoprotein SlyB
MQKSELRIAIILIAGTLLLGGCSNLTQSRDDKAITSDIQAKLFEDPVLKTRNIQVMTQNGVVSLAGNVDTDLEKAAVERIAGQVSGVKSVMNQLAVSSTPASTTPLAPETAAPARSAIAEAAPEPAPPKRVRHHPRASSYQSNESAAPAPAQPAPEVTPAAATSLVPAAPAPAPAPAPAQTQAPAPASPPPPETVTIPSGTVVTIRMIDSIDSSRNRPGEEFVASVDSPIVVGDKVVIPKGADARVRLVQATSAGHISGSSELKLELIGITARGTPYTVTSGYYEQHGASRGKRSAETIGGGAALGGLLGAVLGRGKGAAIGAAVGAGAGTAVQASTRGQQVKVPSETKLDFTLKSPVTVTM